MLIIDMPMPMNCFDCPCVNTENGVCQADKERRYTDSDIPKWCPLRELVRCGECIMRFEENGEKYCGGVFHKLDWFCADGERKDNTDLKGETK